MFASNGILFNHESPIRGETFVSRKITRAVARIALGLQEEVFLGNLDAKRDWGHAKDYVEAMYLILQQPKADDFVIATGVTVSVREFFQLACKEAGLEIEFKGTGINEKAYVVNCTNPEFNVQKKKPIMSIDERYFRPSEVDLLIGDATKAREVLGWKPKYNLNMLVNEMMASDIELFRKDKYLKEGGHNVYNYHE
jgi:GDPmannose 4,6-dehydratase